MGGGTILDLGVYAIQFCQFVFEQEPLSIHASGVLSDDEGIDVEVNAELKYRNNGVAKIKTSFLENLSGEAKVVGTKGTITVCLNFYINVICFTFRSIFAKLFITSLSLTIFLGSKLLVSNRNY